jgi:poly-gamma-glutamate synthesis protein (capsule biosynthesis protein)
MRRLYLIALILLMGCTGQEPLPTAHPTAILPSVATAVANPPVAPTPETAATAPPPTPVIAARYTLTTDTAVSATWRTAAQEWATANPTQWQWMESGPADVTLTSHTRETLGNTIYALAAPFATVEDSVQWTDLQAAWQSGATPIFTTAATQTAVTPLLGPPGTAVQILPESDLIAAVWDNRPAWVLLPFDALTPELKAMQIDGASLFDRSFDPATYPLTVPIGVTGDATAVAQLQREWNGPTSNRAADKLTSVALTGVTALVRATAYNMEQFGILWPGEEIGPILREADIAHISNEIAFAPDCPYPSPVGGTTFCSDVRYFDLIQNLEADVIELTGNHQNDWGAENAHYTLDMYDNAGLPYYGGGRNLADSAEPALFEHNGNKIAFVGCNSYGPTYAWATETGPGSRPCTDDILPQITALRDAGYQVISTLQFTEYYQYPPTSDQVTFYQRLAQAGATAVSGSQGHHAQGFAFSDGAFIHYGLGNTFFDQMDALGTRQTFVDTYHFYNGRLLNVELWTGLIENYARPRTMTPEERRDALMSVFQGSGW